MTADRSLIAVTAGDPCGIGPEVLLKALSGRSSIAGARLIVIGDLPVFKATAKRLRLQPPHWPILPRDGASTGSREPVTFLDCGHRETFSPGHPSAASGKASLSYLDRAIELWREGGIHGLVTGPVTKWTIARTHHGFVGQTERLARAMGRSEVVMMFVSPRLRVALVTRHLPLRRVPSAVSRQALRSALRLTAEGLRRYFKIPRPRLALCGLNPHAGEGARCGVEEETVMKPVLRELRRRGVRCDGPFAADGLFASGHRYDAVVCGYHDQGLIPFKMAARDQGCQLSVGLPIVRTSPDHGSGLDIAGKGIAHPGSMRYALRLAVTLADAHGF